MKIIVYLKNLPNDEMCNTIIVNIFDINHIVISLNNVIILSIVLYLLCK